MSDKTATPAAFDWRDLHRRLDAVSAIVEGQLTADAQRTASALKERARALAQPLESASPVDSFEAIEFVLAYERYAIESAFVNEIYPVRTLTALPCVPAFVMGIINVRGEVRSVIDLRTLFELPSRGITDLDKALILEADGMILGVLADSIVGVCRLDPIDIKPPPHTFTGLRNRYLKGVTAERLAVLDARALLSDPRIVVADSVES